MSTVGVYFLIKPARLLFAIALLPWVSPAQPVRSLPETLTGTIRSIAIGNPAVINAKVVVFNGTLKVDSASTDSTGRYGIALSPGRYTLKAGAYGFKSIRGGNTQDTIVTVNAGQATPSNFSLAPAASGFEGSVTHCGPKTGATVILSMRTKAARHYEILDSTTTDANGHYAFGNLIAASDANDGDYKITIRTPDNPYPRTQSSLKVADGVTAPCDFSQDCMSTFPITAPGSANMGH